MAVSDYIAQATLLDNFNRANEGPPPSASWLSSAFSTGTSQMAVVSNALKRPGSGYGSAVWGTQYGPDTILIVTLSTVGDFTMILRGQAPGSGAWDGYELAYTNSTHTFLLDVVTNNTNGPTLASTSSTTLSNGDKVAFMVIDNTLSMAVNSGGAWSADLLTASAGASITGAGYVGIWANGTTPVFDDFSAGTVTPISSVKRMMMMGCG